MTNFTSKMGPWASKMRPWSSQGTLWSAGVDFGAFFLICWTILGGIWGSFWGHFGIIFALIFRPRFWMRFGSILASIWEAFGSHFENLFGPKGYSERKHRFSKKHEKPLVFIAKMRVGGLQMTTFWLPGGTFSTLGNGVDF